MNSCLLQKSCFLEKANRHKQTFGKKIYKYPLKEIQDQIGARIVVYYLSDVESITHFCLKYFREVENQTIIEVDPNRFGYEAKHLTCFIPPDIRTRFNSPIPFFELQICTLFQHAWAQAEHDIGYKTRIKLDYEKKKFIAFAAAQAWSADRIFEDLKKKGMAK
jgi:ppGpp synthetase/RelA/SpoT-type nucleotidyltranferase